MCLWFGKVFPSRYSFPAGGPSQWAQILRHADERGGGQEGAVSREPYFHPSSQPASPSRYSRLPPPPPPTPPAWDRVF